MKPIRKIEASLKQVEQAREVKPDKTPEEKEEDEKAAVHSSDEKSESPSKPDTDGHLGPEPPKRSQNGKPKRDLVLWSEIEGLLGKALNRADELNRLCPNPKSHDQFIWEVKACMQTLEDWKEAVK